MSGLSGCSFSGVCCGVWSFSAFVLSGARIFWWAFLFGSSVFFSVRSLDRDSFFSLLLLERSICFVLS